MWDPKHPARVIPVRERDVTLAFSIILETSSSRAAEQKKGREMSQARTKAKSRRWLYLRLLTDCTRMCAETGEMVMLLLLPVYIKFTIYYPPLIIQFVMHAAVLGDYSILLIKLMIHPTCRAELVNARRRQRRPVRDQGREEEK